jgi:hypothetical protein
MTAADRQAVHTGGCQCGAVRYALFAEPANASICHCRMCQKAFGSFFAPLAGVSMSDFAVTKGALSVFKSSDAVERGFCKACGTPLTFRYLTHGAEPSSEGLVNEIDVSIGSLDQPQRVKPRKQYGTEARMPWFDDLHGLAGAQTDETTSAETLGLIKSSNRQHPDHD